MQPDERTIDTARARRYGAKAAREGQSPFSNEFERRALAVAWVDGYFGELAAQQSKVRN